MDEQDGVNLFISEGAGVSEIVAAMEAAGEEVPRDPFGHVQLDKINPGQWFAKQFAAELGADKVLVQKSGYFSRSAAANDADLALIRDCTNYAVDAALRGESGVVGQDEERGGELRAIEFERIAGGKAFDASVPWFTDLLRDTRPGLTRTYPQNTRPPALDRRICDPTFDPVDAALNIEKSVTGQPWRWRRPADPRPADGCAGRRAAARPRGRRATTSPATAIPGSATSCPTRAASRTWTRARSGSPTRSRRARPSPSSAIMTSTARPARPCWCCCSAGSAPSRSSISPTG